MNLWSGTPRVAKFVEGLFTNLFANLVWAILTTVVLGMVRSILPAAFPGVSELLPYLVVFTCVFVLLTAWRIQSLASPGAVALSRVREDVLPPAQDARLRELAEWDARSRNDWWTSSRVLVELQSVNLDGLANASVPKLQVNVRFINLTTEKLQITNLVGDSGLVIEWLEPNEGGAVLTHHFETGEAQRINQVDVWRGTEGFVQLLFPVSESLRMALLRARAKRGIAAWYQLKGTWVAVAFGETRNLNPRTPVFHDVIRA